VKKMLRKLFSFTLLLVKKMGIDTNCEQSTVRYRGKVGGRYEVKTEVPTLF
jgi:hypothetical protein